MLLQHVRDPAAAGLTPREEKSTIGVAAAQPTVAQLFDAASAGAAAMLEHAPSCVDQKLKLCACAQVVVDQRTSF